MAHRTSRHGPPRSTSMELASTRKVLEITSKQQILIIFHGENCHPHISHLTLVHFVVFRLVIARKSASTGADTGAASILCCSCPFAMSLRSSNCVSRLYLFETSAEILQDTAREKPEATQKQNIKFQATTSAETPHKAGRTGSG